jgi:hypothetical protein
VVHDPSFGPVLACGAGGAAVELLKDVAVRLTPLTGLDAACPRPRWPPAAGSGGHPFSRARWRLGD